MSDPLPRRRQRGFSLIVVFVIIIVMVGVASAVMITTQGDLQVAGNDREQMSALYAAEAGVSWAQWILFRFPQPTTTPWTLMLKAAYPSDPSYSPAMAAMFCGPRGGVFPASLAPMTTLPTGIAPVAYNPLPGSAPPTPGAPVIYDSARGVQYFWCIHNNALDPEYRKTSSCVSPPGTCPDGDIVDGDGIMTIESYGFYYGPGRGAVNDVPLATAHVTVDVSYYNPTPLAPPGDYPCDGCPVADKLAPPTATSTASTF